MTKMYQAKITASVGGPAIEVETPAGDAQHAEKLINSIYAPRVWLRLPKRIK